MTYNGLDIYEMVIETLGDGLKYISVVDEPAVERNWVCFKKEKEKEIVKFNVANEEKRLVSGVLMMANYPILRIDGDYQYYITYSPETIKQMAEKMNIKTQSYQAYECNISMPTAENLLKIVEILNISLDELFEIKK